MVQKVPGNRHVQVGRVNPSLAPAAVLRAISLEFVRTLSRFLYVKSGIHDVLGIDLSLMRLGPCN
jgi:hypothetical protein